MWKSHVFLRPREKEVLKINYKLKGELFIKRFICLFLVLATLLIFTSCGSKSAAAEETSDKRFEVVYSTGSVGTQTVIFVDHDTNVMHMFIKSGYGGGLTMMMDETGKPLIWEGE